MIHRSCKYLIEEMQGYSWDEKAAAKGEDVPIKVNDHGCDTLRYGIMTPRSRMAEPDRPGRGAPELRGSLRGGAVTVVPCPPCA